MVHMQPLRTERSGGCRGGVTNLRTRWLSVVPPWCKNQKDAATWLSSAADASARNANEHAIANEWGPLGGLAGDWESDRGGLDTAYSHSQEKVLGTPPTRRSARSGPSARKG